MNAKRITAWLLCAMALFQHPVQAADQQLMAVGQAVGIDVSCSGLLVVGFPENSAAKKSGIHTGDLIYEADGEKIETISDLKDLLQDKKQVTLTAMRGQRSQSFIVPTVESQGQRIIGANVKAEMAGIGTITYYDPEDHAFGALGHGITDGISSELFPVKDGFLCKASVVSVERGQAGTPGMLQGAFDSSTVLGEIEKNTACGIFGVLHTHPDGTLVPVAEKKQIRIGPAQILCNVEGDEVAAFDIEIRKLYPLELSSGRSIMFEVTDPELLAATGGIVQGMSGSPILQDGRLLGAVTHVMVSDPTMGYGIFIRNMLDAA